MTEQPPYRGSEQGQGSSEGRAQRRDSATDAPPEEPNAFRKVLTALNRRFWILLGACVLLLAVALTFFVQQMPTTYSATSIVALRSTAAVDMPADSQKLLAGEYAVFLSSPANIDSATAPYKDAVDGGKVAVTVDPDTTTLRIVVTTGDKKASVNVANSISKLAVSRGQDEKRANVISLAQADDASTVAGPKRTLYLGAGLVLIIVIAGSSIYLRRRPA